MPSAQQRGWGPPCDVPKRTLVRADGLRLPVHSDLLDLVALLIDLTEMMGYDVKPGQTWGGLCRKIKGTNVWSNHAWWLAIDLNSPANPYASADWHRRNARGTRPFGLALVCDIPQQVIEMWESHGFGWGGRYKSKPDPMHMEYMDVKGSPAKHLSRLRNYLAGHQGGVKPPPPNHTPNAPTADITPEDIMALPILKVGSKGQHVRNMQGLLVANGRPVTVDGDFGNGTRIALERWQHDAGIGSDGICGNVTWRRLIGL